MKDLAETEAYLTGPLILDSPMIVADQQQTFLCGVSVCAYGEGSAGRDTGFAVGAVQAKPIKMGGGWHLPERHWWLHRGFMRAQRTGGIRMW